MTNKEKAEQIANALQELLGFNQDIWFFVLKIIEDKLNEL